MMKADVVQSTAFSRRWLYFVSTLTNVPLDESDYITLQVRWWCAHHRVFGCRHDHRPCTEYFEPTNDRSNRIFPGTTNGTTITDKLSRIARVFYLYLPKRWAALYHRGNAYGFKVTQWIRSAIPYMYSTCPTHSLPHPPDITIELYTKFVNFGFKRKLVCMTKFEVSCSFMNV